MIDYVFHTRMTLTTLHIPSLESRHGESAFAGPSFTSDKQVGDGVKKLPPLASTVEAPFEQLHLANKKLGKVGKLLLDAAVYDCKQSKMCPCGVRVS